MPILVRELIDEIETFRFDLIKHEELWAKSLAGRASYSFTKREELGKEATRKELAKQVAGLGRRLGRLRPYLARIRSELRGDPSWTLTIPATHVKYDALETAVGLGAPQMKGPSIRSTKEGLTQILGRLDDKDPDDSVYGVGEDPEDAEAEGSHDLGENPNESSGSHSPTTLESVTIANLLRGLGRLSVGAWLTIGAIVHTRGERPERSNLRALPTLHGIALHLRGPLLERQRHHQQQGRPARVAHVRQHPLPVPARPSRHGIAVCQRPGSGSRREGSHP